MMVRYEIKRMSGEFEKDSIIQAVQFLIWIRK